MIDEIYKKIEDFVEEAQERFPGKSIAELRCMCGHLANHVQWKKRSKFRISQDDVRMQRFLLERKYNAGTCYRWLLVYTSTQKDVKELVKQGKLSLRRASEEICWRNKSKGTYYPSKQRLHYAVFQALDEWINPLIGTPLGDDNMEEDTGVKSVEVRRGGENHGQ